MKKPLMSKATAVWLINHTALTFQQIADFCQLHLLEIEALADTETSSLQELSPLVNHQLTQEEIERCTNNPKEQLQLQLSSDEFISKKNKRYTLLSKRQDRPEAILWLVRNYPQLSTSQVCSLLNTTQQTVHSIRTGAHWNFSKLVPKDPMILEFFSQEELEKAIAKSSPKKEKKPE